MYSLKSFVFACTSVNVWIFLLKFKLFSLYFFLHQKINMFSMKSPNNSIFTNTWSIGRDIFLWKVLKVLKTFRTVHNFNWGYWLVWRYSISQVMHFGVKVQYTPNYSVVSSKDLLLQHFSSNCNHTWYVWSFGQHNSNVFWDKTLGTPRRLLKGGYFGHMSFSLVEGP